MKKQVVYTAVASLLTFASVAVLPAFALDTSRQTYDTSQKSEDSSRHRMERERYDKGGYGKGGYDRDDWRGKGGYDKGGYDRDDSRGHGGYRHGGYDHGGYKGPRS